MGTTGVRTDRGTDEHWKKADGVVGDGVVPFSLKQQKVPIRPGVRPDVRAARVSSAAPKKKSFDRGGPVWPPLYGKSWDL